MGEHSQVIFGGPSALKRRQARCCGETTHTRLRGPLRGRKGLQGLSWGARLSRLQRPPGGLDPTMQPPNSSLRQRAQQSAILCDRQRLGGPRVPVPPPTQAPTPPPGTAVGFGAAWLREEGWSNGGWRREAGSERRRIPLRSKANQYQPRPERFKSLSTIPAPPSLANKWQESCLDPSLGRSIVSSGEECLGGESQPAGWAECGPAASGGLGTPEHQQDPSWDFHTPALEGTSEVSSGPFPSISQTRTLTPMTERI